VISVIIPTVNESEHLPQALRMLRENRRPTKPRFRRGSSDGTLGIAAQYGARVLRAPRPAVPHNECGHNSPAAKSALSHADTQVGFEPGTD